MCLSPNHTSIWTLTTELQEPLGKANQNHNEISLHTNRMAILKTRQNKTKDDKCWQGCEELQPLYTAGGNAKWCYHYGKQVSRRFLKVPRKIKNKTTCDTAIPLLAIYLNELKSGSQRDISTPMFILALIAMVEIWKQCKCPFVDEQMKECDIYIQWSIIQPQKGSSCSM